MKKFDKNLIRTNIIKTVLNYKKNVIWKQPWKTAVPENFVTGEKYKDFIYQSVTKYWVTESQLKKLGGKVKKGKLCLYRKSIKFFNLCDCVGIKVKKQKIDKKYNKCEKIVRNYLNNTNIEVQLDFERTFYNRAFNIIRIPSVDCFINPESYYASLFHELVHSTAHKSRLNRFKSVLPKFGSREYNEEDLVAELGACILCTYTGISSITFSNNLSYIGSLLGDILNDSRIKNKEEYKRVFVEKCFEKAQEAVDYILNSK